jgi:hypothetical protein
VPSAGAMRAAHALYKAYYIEAIPDDYADVARLLERESGLAEARKLLMDVQGVLEDCEAWIGETYDPEATPPDLLRHVRLVLARIEGSR